MSTCLYCGRHLHYFRHTELCQQCAIRINHHVRRRFRRNPNAYTQREDMRKKYRLGAKHAVSIHRTIRQSRIV